MRCPHCFREFPDGSSACPWCGKPVNSYKTPESSTSKRYSSSYSNQAAPGSSTAYPNYPSKSARPPKGKRIALWCTLGIAAVLAVGIVVWLLVMHFHTGSADPAVRYANVQTEQIGADGQGTDESGAQANAANRYEQAASAFEEAPSIDRMKAVYESADSKEEADALCSDWVDSLWQNSPSAHVDDLIAAEDLLHKGFGISEGLTIYRDLMAGSNGRIAFSNSVHIVDMYSSYEKVSRIYLMPELHEDGIYFRVDGSNAENGLVALSGATGMKLDPAWNESEQGIHDIRFLEGPYKAEYQNGTLVFMANAASPQSPQELPDARISVDVNSLICQYSFSYQEESRQGIMYKE